MAQPEVDEHRVFTPYLPSLSHLASVRVAIGLFDYFDADTLQQAYDIIEQGLSLARLENGGDPWVEKVIKAQKALLFIPVHLRESVMEAVHGMQYLAGRFEAEHSLIFQRYEVKCVFYYWRSDGRVNRPKTAQHLICTSTLTTRQKFLLACKYCLEDTIVALWPMIEESSEMRHVNRYGDSMVEFWISRMRDSSRVPWTLAIKEYFKRNENTSHARYCYFFPSLTPEEREVFVNCLRITEVEDFLLCMYSMTKEEVDIVVQNNLHKVFEIALEWPVRSFFVKTMEKLWNYIDECSYRVLVTKLFNKVHFRRDFNYCDILEELYSSTPSHLKDTGVLKRVYGLDIESSFETARKRKKAQHEDRISTLKQLVEMKMEEC